eukprot:6605538-Prorocentrum_lima.AAC.1
MTSSLVGSEMCIRDSLRRVGFSPHQFVLGRHPRIPASLTEQLETRRSVSYTHLTLPTICSV